MRTLGFDVARWMTRHLPSPGDLRAPLALSGAQVDLLADWYASMSAALPVPPWAL
jgi:hypothetical protein